MHLSEETAESLNPAAMHETALHSLAQLNLNGGRKEILAYFKNTWALTEMLFSALTSDAAFYIRPYHKTRHPLIFYFAHPVCFYVNKLLVSGFIDKPVNQDFELLFETGVDEMTWDDLHEGEQDVWPPLDAVKAYRQQVYQLVCDVITKHPALDTAITMDSPAWGLVMAFEHERIHLETSSVLMRELPPQYVRIPESWPAAVAKKTATALKPVPGEDCPAENPLQQINACKVSLGKPRLWPGFGWDNEYGREERSVGSFRTSKYLISNAEFHRFVADGGYENPAFWSVPGWSWRQFRNVKWPTFWVQDGPAGSHRYKLRSTFEVIDMQWDWPALVNYYEAKAYCAWLTAKTGAENPYRLLSEAEHQALREPAWRAAANWQSDDDESLALDGVLNGDGLDNANLNLRFGSESPVDAFAANSQGIHDAMGNVWQWCEDAFHPLAGFEIHPYYTDFSTPCFDGEHQMILGGSFISTGHEASIWARFHFRPHFFQHAGFRVVQGPDTALTNKYESTELVDQYLLFHYGSAEQQRDSAISARAGHPQTGNLVEQTVKLMEKYAGAHVGALDLGCAVGASTFQLARRFGKVTGLDYSRSFIRAANHLKRHGNLDYQRLETGTFQTQLQAVIAPDIDRKRVQFLQGDATKLHLSPLAEITKPFDAVLLSNLLCRLADPASCLRQFVDSDRYLAGGGILVIASPNTWMEIFTPRDKFFDGETSEQTLARIGAVLKGFEILHEEDFPFMIREHRRKYEYIVSQLSVWRKK